MSRSLVLGLVLAVAATFSAMTAGCGGDRPADRSESPRLTMDEETAAGRLAGLELEKTMGGRLADLAVQAYVRTVGERVARSTHRPQLLYEFTVLDSNLLDALALPGGPVYVTRGLLEGLKTEGELAAVLARQMAHINARHAEERIGREALDKAARGVAQGGSAKSQATADLGRLLVERIKTPYPPAVESAADRLGLDYLAAAGYDPEEMVRLLGVLVSFEGPAPSAVEGTPEPSRPGPNPEGRREAIEEVIRWKYPDRVGRTGVEEYRREVLDRLKPNR